MPPSRSLRPPASLIPALERDGFRLGIAERRAGVVARPGKMVRADHQTRAALAAAPARSGPLGALEFQRQAEAFKPLVDPDLALFVQVSEKPVGFVLAFPDANAALMRATAVA